MQFFEGVEWSVMGWVVMLVVGYGKKHSPAVKINGA